MSDARQRSQLQQLVHWLHYLRIRPFDTATAQGRADERLRNIAWTSLSAVAAKCATALAMLITVPLSLDYLGVERFGLWMAITAILAMLNFADLGLGNGILNLVSHASGRDSSTEIRAAISSGFGLLLLSGAILALLFSALAPAINWADLLGLQSELARSEVGPVLLALVLCTAAGLPLAVTQKAQLGMQQGYWANLWETAGSLAGMLGVILAIRLDGGLLWIALAFVGLPVLCRALNTLTFFVLQARHLAPTGRCFRLDTVQRLLSAGGLFFVLQLAVIIGFQSDNIVISRLLGAEAVSDYAVALKLYTLPAMFLGMLVIAQWPAYGEAKTRGDAEWIRHTFRRTLFRSLALTLPVAALLALVGGDLLRLWAGPGVEPSQGLLLGMSLWCVLLVAGNVISSLLNGLHVVRFQVICATLMASANIALSILLVQSIGVAGAIYGTLLAYTLFSLLPCWYYCHRHLRLLGASALPGPNEDSSGAGTP